MPVSHVRQHADSGVVEPLDRRDDNDEHGMITLWILGLVLVLFAVGGISLDLWRVFGDRRELVSMADAAAAAGAFAIV